MNSQLLDRLNGDIERLTLPEQVLLMERLAQSIRVKTMRQEQMIESQLAMMAADPEIQREIGAIEAEFAKMEKDKPPNLQ